MSDETKFSAGKWTLVLGAGGPRFLRLYFDQSPDVLRMAGESKDPDEGDLLDLQYIVDRAVKEAEKKP